MMLTLLAAVAAQTVSVPPTDPDLHCMAAYLFAAGSLEAEAKVTAEEKAQVASLVTYYLGKLHGRYPGIALGPELRAMIVAPDFANTTIDSDVARCNAEVEGWSGELSKLGEGLDTASPGSSPH